MTYHDISSPGAEPLTLAETKAHLRLDGDAEDDLLLGLIAAARSHLEAATGLALITRTVRLYRDAWPEGPVLEVSRGPVRAVSAIRIFDEAGDENLFPLDGIRIDGEARPARIYLPGVPAQGQALNGIEIDIMMGFGESGADVPDGLRQALLRHVALMYEFRGAVSLGQQPAAIPDGYDRLVEPYRMRRL